ncbi:hypothetical protein BXZ70DRAFT_909919 [Cristinia sonorae]|uniref:Uncharacterized protein n=1 Tax=Cristinia sonorae TaxID=1940300 RepID=A0A8K0UGT9_9AGAR|nr:hypothetical protein BXZ70DRAFT_909919 [Cristinia sonorae]
MQMTKSLLALAALATSAFAQSIAITGPPAGTTVTAGQGFVVDIARPNTLSPSQEVAVVVALSSCGSFGGGTCDFVTPDQVLGRILYSGPYTPTHHTDSAPGSIEFYQNFTVTVPDNFAKGPASLNVAHFNLIGAGPFPSMEVKNITVIVA